MSNAFTPALAVGMTVRRYDEDDWFNDGMVIEVDSHYVTVDFCDWIERFDRSTIHWHDSLLAPCFIATQPGVRMITFNRDAAPP